MAVDHDPVKMKLLWTGEDPVRIPRDNNKLLADLLNRILQQCKWYKRDEELSSSLNARHQSYKYCLIQSSHIQTKALKPVYWSNDCWRWVKRNCRDRKIIKIFLIHQKFKWESNSHKLGVIAHVTVYIAGIGRQQKPRYQYYHIIRARKTKC